MVHFYERPLLSSDSSSVALPRGHKSPRAEKKLDLFRLPTAAHFPIVSVFDCRTSEIEQLIY